MGWTLSSMVHFCVLAGVAVCAADAAVRGAAIAALERPLSWVAERASQVAVSVAIGAVLYIWLWFRATEVTAATVELEPAEADDDWRSDEVRDTMQIRDPRRKGWIQCLDPATLEFLGEVPAMNKKEVDECVAAAREAQRDWARVPFSERRRVMRVLAKTTLKYQDAICRVSSRDTGKTHVEGLLGEIMTTLVKIAWICDEGEETLQPEYRSTSLLTAMKSARVEYHPLGVIGVIAPWNYPFHNYMNHVISSLFAGNANVSKVSEYASWSGQLFLRLVRASLEQCGHSPDLVQVVTGFGEAGVALVESDVDKIIFTGSPAVGKMVMAGAAKNLKPVVLELGGKDPAILCEDVALAEVGPVILRGAFQNCGQNCIGIERVYVYDGIYDEFVDYVTERITRFKQGAPLGEDADGCEFDQGAMTMPAQIDIVQALVDDAVAKGARLVTGGKVAKHLGPQFYEPTLLVDVTHDMDIANEEVFGPVMTVIRVADDEDCIAQVNSIKYGLGSNVFSRDAVRAEAIASRIRAGMSAVNDFAVQYMAQSLPFGGVNISGFDRFAGKEGLRGCCLQKSVIKDKIPFIRSGGLPPVLQYPTSTKSVGFLKGLIGMAFADTIGEKLRGIATLIRNAM